MLGQASESVEDEERDRVTATMIQCLLPMPALAGLGFRAKSGYNGLEIDRNLRGGEAIFRMWPESFLTGMSVCTIVFLSMLSSRVDGDRNNAVYEMSLVKRRGIEGCRERFRCQALRRPESPQICRPVALQELQPLGGLGERDLQAGEVLRALSQRCDKPDVYAARHITGHEHGAVPDQHNMPLCGQASHRVAQSMHNAKIVGDTLPSH